MTVTTLIHSFGINKLSSNIEAMLTLNKISAEDSGGGRGRRWALHFTEEEITQEYTQLRVQVPYYHPFTHMHTLPHIYTHSHPLPRAQGLNAE